MKTAPRSSLTQLRAKTDRELTILVRRELENCWTGIREARCQDAERSYAAAKTLLSVAVMSAKDRSALTAELEMARHALPRCAASAA